MNEYQSAVYIGRFQPFHSGHLAVVKHGLEIADKVVIVVGSAQAAPNIRNPWSFVERQQMIHASCMGTGGYSDPRVRVVGVRDYFYNENAWIAEVQAKTSQAGVGENRVALLGDYKDSSSYYLNFFPQWEFVATPTPEINYRGINGTAVRTLLLREKLNTDWQGVPVPRDPQTWGKMMESVKRSVPSAVYGLIDEWAATPIYATLAKEWEFVEDYKASWAKAPYPPIFVTTDAVVTCSGHVLVIKRGHNPGKGLYALPGGFLKPQEKIRNGMLRELREETGIKVDKLILEGSIVAKKVFDHPERSLRGRTISHGFHIQLKDGRLPDVKGDDDASEAFWMPLMDVSKTEQKWFEDHAAIVHYFTNR